MKLPRNFFRRKKPDLQSVLDYESTEALASALAGQRCNDCLAAPNSDSAVSTDSSSSSSSHFQKTNEIIVDWKLPVFDTNTTKTQTLECEVERLVALRSYNILVSEREEVFDRITNLAAEVFNAPIAIINLVDLGRTWFLSGHGTGDHKGSPRSVSFCSHVVQGKTDRPLVVPDVLNDFRFKNFPTVTGPPYIRFYAGTPLISSEGYKLGSLCIMDIAPRLNGLTESEQDILADLANVAMQTMVERRDKLLELQNVSYQDTKREDNFDFSTFDLLLGPAMTDMPRLLQSINSLVEPLPRKVSITIQLDATIPVKIECNDVLLLRASLMLLSNAAGRTVMGSIHLRIQVKKKRIMFACEDTGPVVQTKHLDKQSFFTSSNQFSSLAAMATIVRSIDGEYGVESASSPNGGTTIFWFSIKANDGATMKSRVGEYHQYQEKLITTHPAQNSVEETIPSNVTAKRKKIITSDPFIEVGRYGGCFQVGATPP
jgi:GAF domain-containing protein